VVARIWEEVLGIERIGIRDNFFDLGGHSLMATQVISRVQEAFQIEIGLRSLFEAPTVAGLVEKMIQLETRAGDLDATARILQDLQDISEDEAKVMLGHDLSIAEE